MNKRKKGNVISALALLLSSCTAFVGDGESEMMNPRIQQKVKNGWSQSGNLITFNQNAGVVLQKEFPGAGNYTVQFGIGNTFTIAANGSPTAAPNAVIRPRALISWNIHGSQVEREVSVVNGTSVSGQAEGVTVRLFDGLFTGMAGVAGIRYPGLINVSKGIRPTPGQQAPIFYPDTGVLSTGPTVILDREITLAPTVSLEVDVPRGCTQVWVTAVDGANPPTVLTAAEIQVTALNSTALAAVASWFPLPPFWAQIPPTTDMIRITNFSAAKNINVSLIFGVDG